MSKTLDKTELVRAAWLVELRRQGHRQCTDFYRSEDARRVCALGLLAEVANIPRINALVNEADIAPDEVGDLAGLDSDQSFEVAARNDGDEFIHDEGHVCRHHKHTFSEIADIVEGWFKT